MSYFSQRFASRALTNPRASTTMRFGMLLHAAHRT